MKKRTTHGARCSWTTLRRKRCKNPTWLGNACWLHFRKLVNP